MARLDVTLDHEHALWVQLRGDLPPVPVDDIDVRWPTEKEWEEAEWD